MPTSGSGGMKRRGKKPSKFSLELSHGENSPDDPRREEHGITLFGKLAAIGFGIAVIAGVGWLYVMTVSPSVVGGDSGELLAVACAGGVAHPPGYPLITLLFKFSIAIGRTVGASAAYSANLANAAVGALSVGLIYLGGYVLSHDSLASVFAAVSFGLSETGWYYALGAEVFCLNNLFTALLAICAISLFRAYESPSRRFANLSALGWCCVSAFVGGLALCNQHTSVLISGFLGVVVLLYQGLPSHTRRCRKWVLAMLGIVCAGAMGLSPYIALPLSHWRGPSVSWGDHSSIQGFLTHFFRKEYGTFSLAPESGKEYASLNLGTLVSSLATFAQRFHEGFNPAFVWVAPAVVVLAAAGGTRSTILDRTTKRSFYFLAFCFAFYISFFCFRAQLRLDDMLNVGVLDRFWLQPFVLLAILVPLALSRSLKFLHKGVRFSFYVLLLALLSKDALQRFPQLDHSNNTAVSQFGKDSLMGLQPNSLLIVGGDLRYASGIYHHYCEDVRPDIVIVSKDLATYEWYRFTMATYAQLRDESTDGAPYYSVFPPHGRKLGWGDGIHTATFKYWRDWRRALDPNDTAALFGENTMYSMTSLLAWNNKRGTPVYFAPNPPEAGPEFAALWSVRPEGFALLAYPKVPPKPPSSKKTQRLRDMFGDARFPYHAMDLVPPLTPAVVGEYFHSLAEQWPSMLTTQGRDVTWPGRGHFEWSWEEAVRHSRFTDALNTAFFVNKVNRVAQKPNVQVAKEIEQLMLFLKDHDIDLWEQYKEVCYNLFLVIIRIRILLSSRQKGENELKTARLLQRLGRR